MFSFKNVAVLCWLKEGTKAFSTGTWTSQVKQSFQPATIPRQAKNIAENCLKTSNATSVSGENLNLSNKSGIGGPFTIDDEVAVATGKDSTGSGVINSNVLTSSVCSVKNIKRYQIGKLMHLRKVVLDDSKPADERPLAVIWSWMKAPERAIDKYCALYHSEGWDVLVVKSSLKYSLRPTASSSLSEQYYSFMKDPSLGAMYTKVLNHSISFGVHQYHSTLNGLRKLDNNDHLVSQIIGQIYDSPNLSYPEDFPRIWSEALITNPVVRRFVQPLVHLFFRIMHKSTIGVMKEHLEIMHNQPVMCPTLFMYAGNDRMANVKVISNLIKVWKSQGLRVNQKTWDISQHAANIKVHPKDYKRVHQEFLKSL